MNAQLSPGVCLGIDVGQARVGVALSDARASFAMPLETLQRQKKTRKELYRVLDLISERDIVLIYVGLPLSMDGGNSASTQMALDWG